MKKFDVTITETREKVVSVEAATKEQAENFARYGYFHSDFDMIGDGSVKADFTVGEGREKQRLDEPLDVLLVQPWKIPRRTQVGGTVEDLEAAVGGLLAAAPLGDDAVILFNEKGKVNGLSLNRALHDESGRAYDIVAGDFLVAGQGEDDFTSLSPEQMEKYEEVFHSPEAFVKMGRSFVVLSLDDETAEKAMKDRPQSRKKEDLSRDAL